MAVSTSPIRALAEITGMYAGQISVLRKLFLFICCSSHGQLRSEENDNNNNNNQKKKKKKGRACHRHLGQKLDRTVDIAVAGQGGRHNRHRVSAGRNALFKHLREQILRLWLQLKRKNKKTSCMTSTNVFSNGPTEKNNTAPTLRLVELAVQVQYTVEQERVQ